MGRQFQFCKMKSSGDRLNNNVNVLNTTEPYTEEQSILYVFYNFLNVKEKAKPSL